MQIVALLFPGQGSQYIGMGKKLCNEFSIAREAFEEANDILHFDLKTLCFNGSPVELNEITNVFLSILTLSVATFRVYMQEIGLIPIIAAGHSLGEYSALTCSGAIEFSDALKILKYRGKLAQQIADSGIGAMTVVNGISKTFVEQECKIINKTQELVNIACYNSSNQFVISGLKDTVYELEDKLMKNGAGITPLLSSPPFHCSIMSTAAVLLRQELNKFCFKNFKFPVISNVYAKPYENSNEIIDGLVLQMINSVQWSNTIEYLNQHGVTTAIEIGPKAVLTNLLGENTNKVKGFTFGQYDDREYLLKLFPSDSKPKILNNQSTENSTVITKCLAMAVCTQNSNFNEDEYYLGVIKPYEQIEKIQNEIEISETYPTIVQMNQALNLLKQIFLTKKVPIDEQKKRFQRIFNETNTCFLLDNFIMPK